MGRFNILLCLTPDDFACQCDKSRHKKVKTTRLTGNFDHNVLFCYILDEDGLTKFLMFCTSVSKVPPMGFSNPSKIVVTTTESVLPNANTCCMELEIPSLPTTFDDFCKQMDMAIECQATGFGVV